MNDHADPTVIAALAEGRLSGAEAIEARAAVAACAHCARHLEDLTILARIAARSDGAIPEVVMIEPTLSPGLDRALEDVIRSNTRARIVPRRAWFSVAAAAAAIVFVVLVVQKGSWPAAEPLLRGTAVFEAAPGGLRAGSGESLHFEIEVLAPLHLAIFRVDAVRVDVVYPDPNPALGTYGRMAPFESGERIRIPPTPLADLPASRAAPRPAFFAVASSTPIGAPTLAIALQAAQAAVAGGPAAVRSALALRFEAVVPLDVR